jgi:hypothetical protein
VISFEEVLLNFDEVEVEGVEVLEEVLVEILLDFDDEDWTEVEAVVGFEKVLEMVLDFDDEREVEVVVGFEEVLEVTLLVFVDETEVEELVDLVEELVELVFEVELLVVNFVLDVDVVFDEVMLVDLTLNVLDVAADVAVHCPVDEGTALAPEPIGMTFVPQLAA